MKRGTLKKGYGKVAKEVIIARKILEVEIYFLKIIFRN